MKKKTFIFMVSAFLLYLVLVISLEFVTLKISSLGDINIIFYLMFGLSQLIIAGILSFVCYFLVKFRNHKFYRILMPIFFTVLFVAGGFMVYGSLLTEVVISNPAQQAELDILKLGRDLFQLGIELFIISLFSFGMTIGIYESFLD
ncbi:hypothetical protein [Acholeplasma hippikon]|nr:hypothetical protein [Acholeplasma hippikon]